MGKKKLMAKGSTFKNLSFIDFRSWDAMQLIQTTRLMIG